MPNRYGGFEAFVEHCGPVIAERIESVTVTCDRSLYPDKSPHYRGLNRAFPPFRANGPASVAHDLAAFLLTFRFASAVLVLGVSGGIWFPLFRIACALTKKRLLVNIDGVEWQRPKHSLIRRALLRLSDTVAQLFAHRVIIDNPALWRYVLRPARKNARMIPYSGDHARIHLADSEQPIPRTCLTICRIEPENNIRMLIDGFLKSSAPQYTIVGNWGGSEYGRRIRSDYAKEERLKLLDPVYDPTDLARLRHRAAVYLHGHSVGGTNPSLVEMIFFECRILCFDVPYHRHTAAGVAEFFSSADSLAALLDASPPPQADRTLLRERYHSSTIADEYVEALQSSVKAMPESIG